MRHSLVTGLVSGLVNVAGSLAVVALLLVRQHGFGAGDVQAFLWWTLPLAAVAAMLGPPLLSVGRRLPAGVGWLLVPAATGLLVLGWLLTVAQLLGPWMGAFSFSVLYPWLAGTGAQLGWLRGRLSARPASGFGWRYWLGGVGAVLGVYVALGGVAALYEYLRRPTPETYLLPTGFRGPFRVVYGEPGGVNPRLENGRRVLVIPPSGVLIIQPEFRAGLVDNTYYLLGRTGTRQELTESPDSSALPRIDLEGTGIHAGAMPDGSFSTESPQAITYTSFRVSDPHAPPLSDLRRAREQQRLDSLTELLVQRCRTRPAPTTRSR